MQKLYSSQVKPVHLVICGNTKALSPVKTKADVTLKSATEKKSSSGDFYRRGDAGGTAGCCRLHPITNELNKRETGSGRGKKQWRDGCM